MNANCNNRIALYGSKRQENHLGQLQGLLRLLEASGFGVTLHPKLGHYLLDRGVDLCGATVSETLPADTGLALSIGGDGTFLRTARWVGRTEIPVLGVNTGHLGFLSSCRLDDVGEMLGAVCRGDVMVEKRMVLRVQGKPMDGESWPYALNEVTVIKDDTTSMISVRTGVNGNFLADYLADGLIVSTPTGSTAYNLAAGGPILEPTLDCMSLAPVAPHTLTVRPLVVGGDSEVELTVDSRRGSARLMLDGRIFPLECGVKLRIKRAGFSTMLVRKKDSGFAAVLRDKLLWNAGSR